MSICNHIFNRGSKKGTICNQVNCTKHKQKQNNLSEKCTWEFKRGPRKGIECGKYSCSKHGKKKTEPLDFGELNHVVPKPLDFGEPFDFGELKKVIPKTFDFGQTEINEFNKEWFESQTKRNPSDFDLFRPYNQRKPFSCNIKSKEIKNSKIIVLNKGCFIDKPKM